MAENSFSRTFIWQRQWFATANNSHTQISHPKRRRLNEPTTAKRNERQSFDYLSWVAGGGLEPPTSGLWARQANQLLHPAMYLYFQWSFSRFAGAKVWQKNETSKSILKIFQNLYQNSCSTPHRRNLISPNSYTRNWILSRWEQGIQEIRLRSLLSVNEQADYRSITQLLLLKHHFISCQMSWDVAHHKRNTRTIIMGEGIFNKQETRCAAY